MTPKLLFHAICQKVWTMMVLLIELFYILHFGSKSRHDLARKDVDLNRVNHAFIVLAHLFSANLKPYWQNLTQSAIEWLHVPGPGHTRPLTTDQTDPKAAFQPKIFLPRWFWEPNPCHHVGMLHNSSLQNSRVLNACTQGTLVKVELRRS